MLYSNKDTTERYTAQHSTTRRNTAQFNTKKTTPKTHKQYHNWNNNKTYQPHTLLCATTGLDHVVTIDKRLSGRGILQPADHLQKSSLACAIRAQQTEHFATRNAHRDGFDSDLRKKKGRWGVKGGGGRLEHCSLQQTLMKPFPHFPPSYSTHLRWHTAFAEVNFLQVLHKNSRL